MPSPKRRSTPSGVIATGAAPGSCRYTRWSAKLANHTTPAATQKHSPAVLVHAGAHVERRIGHVARRAVRRAPHDHVAGAVGRPHLHPVHVVAVELDRPQPHGVLHDQVGGDWRLPGAVWCDGGHDHDVAGFSDHVIVLPGWTGWTNSGAAGGGGPPSSGSGYLPQQLEERALARRVDGPVHRCARLPTSSCCTATASPSCWRGSSARSARPRPNAATRADRLRRPQLGQQFLEELHAGAPDPGPGRPGQSRTPPPPPRSPPAAPRSGATPSGRPAPQT